VSASSKANGAPKPEGTRSEQALARFHEEAKVQIYDSKNLLRLWPYLRPHRVQFFGSLALLLLASAFALTRPLIMGNGRWRSSSSKRSHFRRCI